MLNRRWKYVISLTILFLVLYPSICFADSIGLKDTGDTNVFKMLLQVIFFLALIIGLFLLLVKLIARRNKSFFGTRPIKSLGGIMLGQNKSLQIVEIGRSIYVIGIGDSVQMIDKIEQAEEVDFIKENLLSSQSKRDSFQWNSLFKKRMNKINMDEVTSDNESFQEVFMEKLQRITNRKQQVNEILNEENNKEWSSDK